MLNRAGNYGDQGLWIRKVYREGFLNRTITAVVRPGDRSIPKTPGYFLPYTYLPVRFIRKPGESRVGVEGNLFPDDGTTVQVTGRIVKTIGELTQEDLRGTAPDTANPALVRYHLATVYDTELPGLDDIVTIWKFEHCPNATE